MPLWRIVPVADPTDPRWQGRAIWSEVIVRAASPAQARLVAARLEHDPDAPPVGNESLGFRSGFEDEKLYWVIGLAAAARSDTIVPAAGPPAIISAKQLPVK